jgi:hypothetical protein
VKLVTNPQDADFAMAGQYEALGSHLLSPGHSIRVKIVSADGTKQVWSGDANDYDLFFGRMRHHGPKRAAAAIVKQLRLNMAVSGTAHYSTGESLPSSAFRTILIGGVPCARNAS